LPVGVVVTLIRPRLSHHASLIAQRTSMVPYSADAIPIIPEIMVIVPMRSLTEEPA